MYAGSNNGQKAVELAEKLSRSSHLRCKMPVMNGLDAAKVMHKQYSVILLTAYSQQNIVNRGKK